MDPEQVYQEVLQEEQGKGSPAPVAEARAKAARVRAEHGSPHPKEAKWWPGAQPHLEGGEAEGGDEAEEEEVVAEEAPAEEPAAEAAPEPEPAPAPAAQPAAEPAPTSAPAGEAAAATPAAVQPEPVAAAAPAAPTGVTHGTATGNRMRPEDGVATTAMLDGQQAMYQRRKLIDELIATGTPAIAAEETGKPRAPFLAILYILIPLIAVLIVVSRDDEGGSAEAGAHGAEAVEHSEGGEAEAEGGGGETGGAALEVVAVNIAFDLDTIEVPADEETTLALDNQDAGTDHNVSIYANQEDGIAKANPIFEGEIFPGVETVVYDLPALKAGEYYFQCDVHPNMAGTVKAS